MTLEQVMRQLRRKPHVAGAKCIWQGCYNLRAGELLCLWHKAHPDGRPIDRSIA